MLEFLDLALAEASKLGAEFADVRTVSDVSTSIVVEDGVASKAVSSVESGLGVRVLVEGCWGYASTTTPTRRAVEEAVRDAFSMAKALSKRGGEKVELSKVITHKASFEVKPRIDPIDVSMEEKVDRCVELEKAARTFDSRVVSTRLGFIDLVRDELVANTFGAEVESRVVYTRANIVVVAFEAGVRQRASERVGKTAGYEVFKNLETDVFSVEAAKRALALLKAGTPPAGRFTAILDQRMTGLFTHEAFGHAAEADAVLAGASILAGMVGKQVASKLVTIVDDPTIEGAFGHIKYDSEGVEAKRKVLVENGVLKGYMHTLETSSRMGVAPNGSGRAQDYRFRPIVRMSNTFIEPGGQTFEEMVEDLRQGVYMKGSTYGHVEPATGNFLYKAEEGYLVEKGEKTKLLRDVSLSGNIFELLGAVDAVGNDFTLGSPGFCGKWGQSVPVDDGGPHIRVREVLVGGAQ
ncbi:MAG: TldD/PmbA family protein [Methanobacteriota archaeon]|nr:MAG: TldD/PmbA family protein [Euryarchaeota archaeon]